MVSEDPGRAIFECRRCGECCKGFGGTYVTEADIRAIARYLAIDPEAVLARYCQFSGGRPVLAQGPDGYCVFHERLCTIHPVKPRMCRQWPYLEAVLVDTANWHIMGASCPGIKTDVPETLLIRVIQEKIGRLR